MHRAPLTFATAQKELEHFMKEHFRRDEMLTDARAWRFFEESVELMQAIGYEAEDVHRAVDLVFAKPVGNINAECGGVMITFLALLTALDLNAQASFSSEFARIQEPEMLKRIKAKQAQRAERDDDYVAPGVVDEPKKESRSLYYATAGSVYQRGENGAEDHLVCLCAIKLCAPIIAGILNESSSA